MTEWTKRTWVAAGLTALSLLVVNGCGATRSGDDSDESRVHPGIKPVSAGAKIFVPNVNWAHNKRTVLIVLAPGCLRCREGAAIYSRLVQESETRGDFKVVAVFPEGAEEGKRLLIGYGVAVQEAQTASLLALGVTETPTLMLVDQSGVVTDFWAGVLNEDQKGEIFSRLDVTR